ncbi:MAG: response regulator transcription factor [Opitutales bacterium]|nr:response regulator transcription factor [Opitutales bacterium]
MKSAPEARPSPARILLLEDETIVRTLLVEALRVQPDFVIAGEAGDLPEARLLLAGNRPVDILLADLVLPSGDGAVFAREVFRQHPRIRILMLTSRTDETSLLRALQAGVHGFLHKRDPLDTLLAAIRAVARGELAYNPAARRLLEKMKLDGTLRTEHALTPREEEILAHLARGRAHKEIAAALGLSPLTVKTHARNLMAKLDAHDRATLTREAVHRGLVI